MNGDACSHYKNRQGFPGPRSAILREREAALPACDSGALRRIACHREFSLLVLLRDRSPFPANELRQEEDARGHGSSCYLAIAGVRGSRNIKVSPFGR